MTVDLPDWARALLRDSRVGRLGSADARGQPLVVPVCYAVADDETAIYSAVDAKPKRTRDLRRLRNIRENPRVSLTVDHWDEDWRHLRWVIVEGRAATLEPGPERARAIGLLTAKYPQYRALGLDAEAAVIAIAPVRILTWRFS